MKCGWTNAFNDLSEDEPVLHCNSDATHTSCDYGPVCVQHKCRCSKPLTEVELQKFRKEALQRAFDEGEGVP